MSSQRDLLSPSPASSTPHLPQGARTLYSSYSSSAYRTPPSLPPHTSQRGYTDRQAATPMTELGRGKSMEAGQSPPDSPAMSSSGQGGYGYGYGAGTYKPGEGPYFYSGEGWGSGYTDDPRAGAGAGAGARNSVQAFFDGTRRAPQKQVPWYRRRWVLVCAGLGLLALVALAVGLGAGLGVRRGDEQAAAVSSSGAGTGTGTGSGGSGAGGSAGNSTTSGNSTAPAAPAYNVTGITPLPKWNWTDPSTKMVGISLGNYLVLERWMSEDWFVSVSSPDAWDEWTFSNLTSSSSSSGATASLLQAHWDSWVTEEDIERVWRAGVNTIRVPTGYWAWIGVVEGEPYVQAGQLDRLERVMEWAYKRGMYVLVDLHGLPGSQNGEQQSGHNTSDVRFYQPAYQNRSDATLQTALNWITSSPYRSVVSAIEVCNEPRPNSDDNFAVLRAYYERAYAACTQRDDPVPMIFHHGFPNTDHLEYWRDFVTGKDPNYLILEDHPYPGNFPLQTDQANILYQVCQDASSYEGYPVPVAVTEWSLTTGVNDTSFEQQFYTQQLTAWSWSAGSVFWSLRANTSQLGVLAAPPNQQKQYSFLDLLAEGGVIATPSDRNESTVSWLQGLQQGCGSVPGERWGNESFTSVSAGGTYTSGVITQTLAPTSTAMA